MATNYLPPQSYLVECFDYDPSTGQLRWKWRPINHFAYDHRRYWRVNKIYAGKTCGKSNGLFVQVGLHYKNWPVAQIKLGRRNIHLGSFKTPAAAHKAWCKAAKAAHGQFFNPGVLHAVTVRS